MRLPQCFIKLPLTFDHVRLAEEISQFGEEEWRAHPQRFEGNSSLVLVSTNGEENDDFSGPMVPTPRLAKMPYVRQVMASFNTVIGRSRLMRLTPGAIVAHHTDSHYFWRNHLRIHVPILTEPEVAFYCENEEVHMARGESWTFNNWVDHAVENRSDKTRIHLVIDTVGSSDIWRMVDGRDNEPRRIDFQPGEDPELRLENYRGLPVLPASEIAADLKELVDDLEESGNAASDNINHLRNQTTDFLNDWQSVWMVSGPTAGGFPEFKRLRDAYRKHIDALPETVLTASNGRPANEAFWYTLDAVLAPQNLVETESAGGAPHNRPRFDRPVFIVAAPRSGSTLLFETLALNRELWSVGDEAHKHFEIVPSLRPNKDNQSNRLTADLATRDVIDTVLNSLAADLVNSDGLLLRDLSIASRPAEVRFLEKTPKNALRIPFILKAFPDARFIFLYRDARQNISSLLDSWRSQQYVTYERLPDWTASHRWSHLLFPGWQDLTESSLAETVAQQWQVTNQTILDDLQQLPDERWCTIEYDALISDTMNSLQRMCEFSQIVFGPRMVEVASRPLSPSKYTLTAPNPDKWKKNAADLEPVIPGTEELMARLRSLR
jgi:hypothetical protein